MTMPPLVDAAERVSGQGQRRTVAFVTTRLWASIGAAAAGTTAAVGNDLHQLAWLAAALFAVALAAETLRLHLRPDVEWQEGRAVAERTKGLAWCFAVGGDPFPLSEPGAEALLLDALDSVRTTRPQLMLSLQAAPVVPDELVAMRSAPLADRRSDYLAYRVIDQQDWYARRSRQAGTAARRWRVVVVVAELAGLILALAWATGVLRIDAGGIAGSILVAASSWSALKQHESLARSYAAATTDLATARHRLERAQDEVSWARAVGGTENVLHAEQEFWLARRA